MTDFKNNLKLSLLQMKCLLICLGFLFSLQSFAQQHPGIIVGNVLDEKNQALEGATVQLIRFSDSSKITALTDKNGAFQLNNLPFGYYKFRVSFIGFNTLTLDSIHFRAERFDFNLNDVILKLPVEGASMEEVVVYLEKPLIQSKDGNITFNAGESALSAGSNASELLTSVPLVTKDPSGRLLVRGKEPRILVDDKPVELNLEQLQDLLESMPGSSIEKIEVMTNPPAQYANEQGGVINITTKKGSVGMSGRVSAFAGSRGQAGGNGSFNYRKQGFSLNVNAGAGYNRFEGEAYSRRHNLNNNRHFNNNSDYINRSMRPNFRMNLNYEVNKFHALNMVLQYNQNSYNNRNLTDYRNLDGAGQVVHLSERKIINQGDNYNPNVSFTYTVKTKKPGESLRLITSYNHSDNSSNRDFYHQYFNPDGTPNGKDSVMQQLNHNLSKGYTVRLNYDLPFNERKTHLNLGGLYAGNRSDIDADASFYRSSDKSWNPLDALTNRFLFRQQVYQFRASVKQVFENNFSTTMGISAEQTNIHFDLYKQSADTGNRYLSFLPFANFNKNWKDVLNLTFSYRRTIRRPGIGELNPTIDFSDPYNYRFGNPGLLPSMAHNFDLVLGKTKNSFYANLGMGYNIVEDIFSQVRTLQPDGKTEITWQNISSRKEFELSTWSGYTVSKQMKVNLSASFTYNTYSDYDKTFRNFRNGGSFTSNLNTNYNFSDLYSATGSFTFNRFANPQGSVRSSLSMNIGLQAKMLKKKLTATINIIDPFVQQRNQSFTYGTDFTLETSSSTQTRNFRLSLGYNLSKAPKKKLVLPKKK